MNTPAIEALNRARSSSAASSSGTSDIQPMPAEDGMDMQKCMTDMSGKLDQILALLKPDAADATEENSDNGNSDS